MSRLQNENTEWILSPIFFQKTLEVFNCKPEIDRFVSCINYQIGQYASWHPAKMQYLLMHLVYHCHNSIFMPFLLSA